MLKSKPSPMKESALATVIKDIDQIIDVILTDEKLLLYVNKLVNKTIFNTSSVSNLNTSSFQLENFNDLVHIIDHSIEKAIDQIQIVDLITNLLQQMHREQAEAQKLFEKHQKHHQMMDAQTSPARLEGKMSEFYDGGEQGSHQKALHPVYSQTSPPGVTKGKKAVKKLNNNEEDHGMVRHSGGSNPNRISLLSISSDEEPHPNIIKRPQYSEKEPEPVSHQASVKRTVQQLNKRKPPLAHYPSSSSAPALAATIPAAGSSSTLSHKQQQHNRNLNRLEVNKQYNTNNSQSQSQSRSQSHSHDQHHPPEMTAMPLGSLSLDHLPEERGHDPNLAGDSEINSFVSSDDINSTRDSEASTVLVTMPIEKSLRESLQHDLDNSHHINNSLFDQDDSFASNGSHRILHRDPPQKPYFIGSSKENEDGTRREGDENEDELHILPKKGAQNNRAEKLMNQSYQVTSEINSLQASFENPLGTVDPTATGKQLLDLEEEEMEETVRDWQRKILENLSKESVSEEDEPVEDRSHRRSYEASQQEPDVLNRSNNSAEASIPPEEIEEEREDGAYESKQQDSKDVSRNYDQDSFENYEQEDQIQPKRGDPTGITFPSVHNYLSNRYDPTKSNSSNIYFFDMDRFTDEVDSSQGTPGSTHRKTPNKDPNPGNEGDKQVQFINEIIQGVYHYDRATSLEAKDMYYTHEELDRFDMHYRKEDAIAEKMGLSWMEWKNQQPDDQEISFSEEEDNNGNDDYNNDHFDYGDEEYPNQDDEYNFD